jgi:hypothetical protein
MSQPVINPAPRLAQSFDNVNILDLAPAEDTGTYISDGFFDKFKSLFGLKPNS